MPFIPAAQIVRVAVEYLLDGQILANIFHVDANEAVTASVINAILDVFETWVNDQLVTVMSEDINVTGLVGKDLTTSTGTQIDRPFDTAVPGGLPSPALPNNVAVVLSWFTDLAGRSFRGRTYMPGIDEASVILSEISNETATAYATVFVELVDALTTAAFDLMVTSFFTGGVPRENALSTPITAVGCNTTTDSQRRRLPGRGT